MDYFATYFFLTIYIHVKNLINWEKLLLIHVLPGLFQDEFACLLCFHVLETL